LIKEKIESKMLLRHGIPDHVPYGYPKYAENAFIYQAVGNRNVQREPELEKNNGKVDPQNEDPRSKIHGY
jgi:hypothetical protein